MLKGLLVTLFLGITLSIAFVSGVPSIIESSARNRLLVSIPQSAPMFGVSVLSASFTSVSTAGLHTALLGLPNVTIRFNQPTAFFSVPFTELSDRTPTYQVTGSDIWIQTGSRAQDEGYLSANRVIISPVPHSSPERELSHALLMKYQESPVISLDNISTTLPFSSSDPQHSLTKGLETAITAIIGEGTTRPFAAIGGVSINQFKKTIPLTVKKMHQGYHLTLDRVSLETLQLLDPLSPAEIDKFEFSPLSFCYVILIRHSAEQFTQRIMLEQADALEKMGELSSTALRMAVYGYLVSQVFGSQGGEELGELFAAGRAEVSIFVPDLRGTSRKWAAKELFKLGVELSEKHQTPPRELANVLLKQQLLRINKQ